MRRVVIACICLLAACLVLATGRHAITQAQNMDRGHAGHLAFATGDQPVRYVCNGSLPGPENAYEASLRYSVEKLTSPTEAGRLVVAGQSKQASGNTKPVPLGGPGPTTSATCSETCTTCVGATCNVATCPKYNTCEAATCMGPTCHQCSCTDYNTCAATNTCDSPPACCKPKCD